MRTTRIPLLILLLSFWFSAAAQHGRVAGRIQALRTKGVSFTPTHLFAASERKQHDPLLDAGLTKGELLQLDRGAMGRPRNWALSTSPLPSLLKVERSNSISRGPRSPRRG